MLNSVTSGHPPENVSPENYAAYTKGHVQNVRRVGDKIVADLYTNDACLASEIENKAMREVSCGYLCVYAPDGAGYKQTNIRGNHVAVVSRRLGFGAWLRVQWRLLRPLSAASEKYIENLLVIYPALWYALNSISLKWTKTTGERAAKALINIKSTRRA